MVNVEQKRNDLDRNIFIMPVTLHKRTKNVTDNIRGSTEPTFTDYVVWAQCSIIRDSHNYVKQGLLKDGDGAGNFRYEYTETTDGTAISPAITIAQFDEVTFGGSRYKVQEVHAILDEYGNVICYDAELVRNG